MLIDRHVVRREVTPENGHNDSALAEPAVLVAVRMNRSVLQPQQLQRHTPLWR